MKAESFVQGGFAGSDGLGIEQEALYTPTGAGALAKVTSFIKTNSYTKLWKR